MGSKIDVMVLRFDREANRISLGLKQILPDPWEEILGKLHVGMVVSGAVTRVVPFGAFIRLENGIEGICPNAELPGERGKRAADVLRVGQQVEVKVVNLRATERRMTLSMRQVEQAKERAQVKEFLQRQEEESRVTIGDLFGSVLSEAADNGGRSAAPGGAREAGGEAAAEAGDMSDQAPPEAAKTSDEGAPKAAKTSGEGAAEAAETSDEAAPEVAQAPGAAAPEAAAGGKDEAGAEPAEEIASESEAETPVGRAKGEETGSAEGEACSSSESPAESEAAKD